MREKETTALLDPYELPAEQELRVELINKPATPKVVQVDKDDIDWDKVFAGLIELPFDLPRD